MKRGFTLIELLVVIAILGILTALVLASLHRGTLEDACKSGDQAACVEIGNNVPVGTSKW